jgi:hypothetical protein
VGVYLSADRLCPRATCDSAPADARAGVPPLPAGIGSMWACISLRTVSAPSQTVINGDLVVSYRR